MRHLILNSEIDTLGLPDTKALGDLQGAGHGRLDTWLAQAGIESSAVLAELESGRWLIRTWTPRHDAEKAVAWLHLVQRPIFKHLLSDVADAITLIERLDLPECVAEHLHTRARSVLAEAASQASREPDALVSFLSEADLHFTDETVVYWRDLSLPAVSVIDAFATQPFGLYRLRDRISRGEEAFDALIEDDRERRLPELRSEFAHCLSGEAGSPPFEEFNNRFPLLCGDPVTLGMMVRELERREGFTPSRGGADNAGLLTAIAKSGAWTEDLVVALADLDEAPLRHLTEFAAAATSSIRAAWERHPRAAAYAALRLHRNLRYAIARDRTQEFADLGQSFRQTLDELPGCGRVLWLFDRISELSIGIAMEKVAWTYLESSAKGHWIWLVYWKLAKDPDLIDAFVRFGLGSLPRETCRDVEPLVVELVRDADRWATLEELAAADGGIAMLRAGDLLRRRQMGLLKADYQIGGDDFVSDS